MPIDVNKYERVRGEFAALLAQFPKNRELARAYDAFCEPSYPRPVIEDAAGETFRKRQRAAIWSIIISVRLKAFQNANK